MAVVQVAVKLGPMRFFEACAQAEIRQLDMTLKHTHTHLMKQPIRGLADKEVQQKQKSAQEEAY